MRSIVLPLLVLATASSPLFADITTCSLTVSHLDVHVIQSSDAHYAVRVPQSISHMVQVSEENEHLYVCESRPAKGHAIELMVPRNITLELDVSQNAKVLIDQQNGPMIARIANGGVLHLVKGSLPQLVLDMTGEATVFAPDCVVQRATVRMGNDADAVLERVTTFAEKSVGSGARLFANSACVYGGERTRREEFSLTSVYQAVGERPTSEMLFYQECAVDPLSLSKNTTQGYEGNPFHSSNQRVKAVLDLLAADVTTEKEMATVLRAIDAVPAELETERQVLGALLCRRLLLCKLAQPIGPGAISPRSLWAVKTVPEQFRAQFDQMFTQMYQSSQAPLTHGGLSSLGAFGEFYARSAQGLSRTRSRVLNTSRVGNKYRWVPFMEHLFQNIDTFVRTGTPVWDRAKAR